jgi:PPK2 family polyphosphate:nucleotide phosphotransferase
MTEEPTTDDRTLRAMRHACLVEPGAQADLAHRSTSDRLGTDKGGAQAALAGLTERLSMLHQRLYAEHKRALLVVLQGLDASGKDGTIRRVFTGLNPQGCDVTSFKAPAPNELAHDYLWRIHQCLPARGAIGIFNRSHYEDVVAAQVIGAIDDERRKRRYDEIVAFEQMLREEGTWIVKIFLHVGKDEQRARLQARLDNPEKRWKFERADLDTRAKWDEYMRLYEAAISATSTKPAPWYVVPADHKWVSGLAAAGILLHTLEELDPKVPPPAADLDGIVID